MDPDSAGPGSDRRDEYCERAVSMAPGRGSDLLDAGDALVAGATVAGDDGFCELAAVAEEQWVFSGEAVLRSVVVDNNQWESRRRSMHTWQGWTGRNLKRQRALTSSFGFGRARKISGS